MSAVELNGSGVSATEVMVPPTGQGYDDAPPPTRGTLDRSLSVEDYFDGGAPAVKPREVGAGGGGEAKGRMITPQQENYF